MNSKNHKILTIKGKEDFKNLAFDMQQYPQTPLHYDLQKTATFFNPKPTQQTSSKVDLRQKNEVQSFSLVQSPQANILGNQLRDNSEGSFSSRSKFIPSVNNKVQSYTSLNYGSPQAKQRFQLESLSSPTEKQYSHQINKSIHQLQMCPNAMKNEKVYGRETSQKYHNPSDTEFWNKVNTIISDSDERHVTGPSLYEKDGEFNNSRNQESKSRLLCLPLIQQKNDIDKKNELNQKKGSLITSPYLDSSCSTRDSLRQNHLQLPRQALSLKPLMKGGHLLPISAENENCIFHPQILSSRSEQFKQFLFGGQLNSQKINNGEEYLDYQNQVNSAQDSNSILNSLNFSLHTPQQEIQFNDKGAAHAEQFLQHAQQKNNHYLKTVNPSIHKQDQQIYFNSFSTIGQNSNKQKSPQNQISQLKQFTCIKPNHIQDEGVKQFPINQDYQLNQISNAFNQNEQEITSFQDQISSSSLVSASMQVLEQSYQKQEIQKQSEIQKKMKYSNADIRFKLQQLVSPQILGTSETKKAEIQGQYFNAREKYYMQDSLKQNNMKQVSYHNSCSNLNFQQKRYSNLQVNSQDGEVAESYQFLKCNEEIKSNSTLSEIKDKKWKQFGISSEIYMPNTETQLDNENHLNKQDFSFCEENSSNQLKLSWSAQGFRNQAKRINLKSKQQENLVKKLFKIEENHCKPNTSSTIENISRISNLCSYSNNTPIGNVRQSKHQSFQYQNI